MAAAAALVIRVYLATLWFRFGVTKVEAGWLTGNPVGALLGVVGAGRTPMPIPELSVVADWLLAVRADVLLSVLLPLIEITLAAAFLSGACVRVAAAGGIVVNTTLLLGGLASVSFDGRIIALQALLLVAGRGAGAIGVAGIPSLVRRAWSYGAAPTPRGGTGPAPRRRAA